MGTNKPFPPVVAVSVRTVGFRLYKIMHAAVSPAPVPLIPFDLNIADRIQSDLLLPEKMPDGDRPVRNGDDRSGRLLDRIQK